MRTAGRLGRPEVLVLAVLAVVFLLLAALTYRSVTASPSSAVDDQCGKPVPERTGGWFCYVPTTPDPSPSPGRS
jgi:hypothetical protein